MESLATRTFLPKINEMATVNGTSHGEASLMNNMTVSPHDVDHYTATLMTSSGRANNTDPTDLIRLAAIFVPIFFGIIICVGFVGNSLVITVMTKIYKHHGQRLNNTNRFILNLAVSDLLFLIFCVPFHAAVYTIDGWLFGGFMCVFTKVCEEMTKIASVYTLVALSVDRFLAVVYATSARQVRTRANAIRGLIFIWISAAGISAPVIFTRVYLEFHGTKICASNTTLAYTKWYEFCISLFGYLLPLLVIICCYVGLLIRMCKTARKTSLSVKNSRNDSRKKVTRIVVLVVIVFTICWMPNHIINLWMQFDKNFDFTSKFTFVFRLIAHCMAYANSCINPLVYAFVSKKFRQDFKKAFTCQYISEAVGSMKAFSRRIIGTVRYSLGGSGNSRVDFVGVDDGPNRMSKTAGPVSLAIKRRQNLSPRSPLSPHNLDPVLLIEEESPMSDKAKPASSTNATPLSSPAMQDKIAVEPSSGNGCAFDETEQPLTEHV